MEQRENESIKTGTTTVGIQFENGTVLATERRASMGYQVKSKKAQKVYEIDDKLAITTAGSVGDTQAIVRYMKARTNMFKYKRDREMAPNSAATMLSNMLQGSKMMPYLGMFLLGGYDTKEERGHVFCIDPSGGNLEEDSYYATGSGSQVAYGILQDGFKEDMSEEDAVELALRAIRSASERDMASGDGFSVMVIGEDGCERLEDDDVEARLEKIRE
ncbi:MAG: archaeal proteasome endopeptidase complex subunit beta [Candidatus Aenigmatarchaeota archaeon]